MSEHMRSHKLEVPLECNYPGCKTVRQYLKYEFDCIPLASQLTTDFVKISIVGGGNTSIAFSLISKKSQALALFWINMEISGS